LVQQFFVDEQLVKKRDLAEYWANFQGGELLQTVEEIQEKGGSMSVVDHIWIAAVVKKGCK